MGIFVVLLPSSFTCMAVSAYDPMPSLLRPRDTPLYVCAASSLSMPLLMDIMAASTSWQVNNVAMNIGLHGSFWIMVFSLYPGVGFFWVHYSGSFSMLCLPLCNPMDCSTPGFPVLHYLPKFAQTHVHWVSDAV